MCATECAAKNPGGTDNYRCVNKRAGWTMVNREGIWEELAEDSWGETVSGTWKRLGEFSNLKGGRRRSEGGAAKGVRVGWMHPT